MFKNINSKNLKHIAKNLVVHTKQKMPLSFKV